MSKQAYSDLQEARHRALREGASAEDLIQATITGLRLIKERPDITTDWDSVLTEIDADLSLALIKMGKR